MHAIKTFESLDDAKLVLMWKGGHEDAFGILYKRHISELLTIAYSKISNIELAEDLVQDSFISFYKQKNQLSNTISIRAYLYVTLKHKIYNHHSKNVSHRRYAEHIQQVSTELDESMVYHIETKELEQQLKNEIENLPAQCQTVFKLSRQDFLSNKEIAAVLKISVNTVEQHMRRALRQLRGLWKTTFF